MTNNETESPPKKLKQKLRIEVLCIFIFSVFVYFIAGKYDILEKIVEFSQRYEAYEIDEFLTVSFFLMFWFLFFFIKRSYELTKALTILNRKNKELKTALSEIKQLRGIIPICSTCKKIRDDEGFWHQVESYVARHTDADFSHSICPDCMKELYPEIKDEPDR